MGSSFADRAWGRESAVFRITGVLTVIGGWFITAGAAFIMSFTIATLNHFGGFVAMLILIGILAAVLINNNKKFNKQQEENVDTLFRQLVRCHDKQQTWQLLIKHVSQTQSELIDFAQKALNGMYADGLINKGTVTGCFTGVITNPAMNSWHRIIFYQGLPGSFIASFLSQSQPGLNVFSSGAGVITGRQRILIDRAELADGASGSRCFFEIWR